MNENHARTITRTATRHETHKTTTDNVWLDSTRLETDGDLSSSFRIPMSGLRPRFAELMEVQRQAGIVHVHRRLDVPLDHVFLLDEIELRIERYGDAGSAAGNVSVTADPPAEPRRASRRLAQSFTLRTPDGLHASGRSRARFVPRSVYERLRNQATMSPTVHDPRAPDRSAQTTEIPFSYNSDDPILADHDSDHVSAMSIVCAVERIVSTWPDEPGLASFGIEFQRYTEVRPTPTIRLHARDDTILIGQILQQGIVTAVFTGETSRRR